MFLDDIVLPASTIQALCDRNKGVGADAIISVTIEDELLRMRYWNADGSPAEMCGNGLRCVAALAISKGLVSPGTHSVKTDAGILQVRWDGTNVDMVEAQIGKVRVAEQTSTLHDTLFYEANAGNPHALCFVDSVEAAPVLELGPRIENDAHFPNRTNVEFVEIVDSSFLKVRVWERGVGETLACGTAMISCAAVAHHLGKASYPLTVEVAGGQAQVWIDEDGYSWMQGPTAIVYEGHVNIEQQDSCE